MRQVQAANGFTRVITSSNPTGSVAAHSDTVVETSESQNIASERIGFIKRQKGFPENNQTTGKQEKSTTSKKSLPPKAQCDLDGCCLSGIYICGRCKEVGYCGVAHQKEHWRLHRKSCAIKREKENEMSRS